MQQGEDYDEIGVVYDEVFIFIISNKYNKKKCIFSFVWSKLLNIVFYPKTMLSIMTSFLKEEIL